MTPRLKPSPRNEQSQKYLKYKGKLNDRYVQFGGLGPNKDEKWNEAYERRINMKNFSNKVNGNTL